MARKQPKPKPPNIQQRIQRALRQAGGRMPYDDLARVVFPPEAYPNAFRHARGGGPPGCFMALSRALRRMGAEKWRGVVRWAAYEKLAQVEPGRQEETSDSNY